MSRSSPPVDDVKGLSEHDERTTSPDDPVDSDAEFGGSEERAKMETSLLRRLDLRHSILIVIYILNYVSVLFVSETNGCLYFFTRSIVTTLRKSPLDRFAFATVLNYLCRAARLRGFEEDLKLTDKQFDTILSILYVGYIIMQIPSYVLLFDMCYKEANISSGTCSLTTLGDPLSTCQYA
jgi:hypothetical protein